MYLSSNRNIKFVSNIKGFVNGSTPKEIKGEKEKYQNLKTQCAFKMAEKINNQVLYVSASINTDQREHIIEELEQLKRDKVDDETKLFLVKKDRIKENIGRSPDYLDNFIMRYYFEFTSGAILFMG